MVQACRAFLHTNLRKESSAFRKIGNSGGACWERSMIESIEFCNFKALRKTTLPLTPFTLLLGPNGAGKTSVLQALHGIAAIVAPTQAAQIGGQAQLPMTWPSLVSVTSESQDSQVEIKLRLRLEGQVGFAVFQWRKPAQLEIQFLDENGNPFNASGAGPVPPFDQVMRSWLSRMQTYALDPFSVALPVPVGSGVSLQSNGSGLAAVLDDLKDNHPERWDTLLAEMCRWLPEYDHILFDKPQTGQKGIALRTKKGGYRIPARELSHGTLVALALLTLAYLPQPPSLVGLEEIDRGLHPRLLRHLQDALYRLSYPESCGETRPPIQVIATTHSPYLLDLYRDHPEEVVLAHKQGLEVEMKRLADINHFEEILGEAPLSEVWYSGVLGGVSVKP
jgi:predicted ATPase